jgi:DNA-binding CsgD family transcriptional regulator
MMADGHERKEIMYSSGVTRRMLENKLYRLRTRLRAKNDLDLVCSGMRKGYLK